MMRALLLAFWLQAGGDPSADGMKALEGQKYEDAVRLFGEAVAKTPEDIAARFHLALSLSLLNRDGEAVAEYKKVLAAQPGLFEAQLNLGVLHLRMKQNDEAMALLGEARKQKPAEYRPNYYMGEALLAAGKLEEAEAALRAALNADGKRPEAQLAMGRAVARQGRVKESAVWRTRRIATRCWNWRHCMRRPDSGMRLSRFTSSFPRTRVRASGWAC
jgi:tetratricopeptide (TPR) repeat protein